MKTAYNTSPAFSIIEVLIGIFVFSLGLVSIYALLASSLKISDYNNSSIIASNLAQEQIELFRNIRDTNYTNLKIWNQFNLPIQPNTADSLDVNKVFLANNYYTLENNLVSGGVEVNNILDPSLLGVGDIFNASNIGNGRLCLDSESRYIYCTGGGDKINFARYLFVQQAQDASGNDIEDAFVVSSKVVWYKRGYYEYELKTIVTDWRRI